VTLKGDLWGKINSINSPKKKKRKREKEKKKKKNIFSSSIFWALSLRVLCEEF